MKKNNVVLIGGGGHCKGIIDSLKDIEEYTIIGILDNDIAKNNLVNGVKVLGGDKLLPELLLKGVKLCFVCIGSIGEYHTRKSVINYVEKIGYNFISVIDRTAILAESVNIGKGVYIGKNCVINSETKIDNFAIINTGSIIEHENRIAEFVHIAPGCVLGGNVTIEEGTHVGMNSTIIQGITIGKNCIIGAGSIILSNISDQKKMWGVIHEK